MLIRFMMDGNPHTLSEIRDHFKSIERLSPLAYRVPMYVSEAKLIESAEFNVVKKGRNILSYQLSNSNIFGEEGQKI